VDLRGFGNVGSDGKIKANFRLPVRSCLHIVFLPVSILCNVGLPAFYFFFNAMAQGGPFGLALHLSRRNFTGMSRDDASDFQPRPGHIRDRGSRAGRRSTSFVSQVLKAAAKANGGPLTAAQMRRDGQRGSGGDRPRKGRCCRIGRGQAAADRLRRSAEQHGPGERMRRVVVKARIVRLKRTSKGADAHLRYLQRDGTTREGERGRLYGPQTDAADGRGFVERGREDRHQFRFIVAPEDGDQLTDLQGFTRDVMGQIARALSH
jgi:hypothetical protein